MLWSDLVGRVRPHVPGCPDMLIQTTIQREAIRFCEDTHIWLEQLQDLYLAEGLYRYQLQLPENTELIALDSAQQVSDSGAKLSLYYPIINPYGLLYFERLPNPSAGHIQLFGVLKPAAAATGFPTGFSLPVTHGIVEGTLAHLFALPGKAWSSGQMATYHRRLYNDEVAMARNRRANGGMNRGLRVKPRNFT